ncbi:MAG: protoporphyrinogen oxidase [Opitutales bacterium]
MRHIGIIGSGITALAKAWQLTRNGEHCTVLECGDHIGGAIQSCRDGSYLAEEGPNSIQVNSPTIEQFLSSIPGLDERIIEADTAANKRYIVRGGQLHAVPMSPLQAITTPLWSIGGRLRALREPFIKGIDPEIEESTADFVRRRLGNELYQYAVNPLIGGIYAGDPEQLSLRHAFPMLHTLEQNHGGLIRGAIAKLRAANRAGGPKGHKRILSFKDGLAELPYALARALGNRVQTRVRIQSIEQSASGWRMDYDGRTEPFDELILTVPAHALGKLPLPQTILEGLAPLERIDYPPVSVLSLAFKREHVAHPLDGFGALIPECERRRILGVLFPSSIFSDRAPEDEVMLTAFVGGERQPALATAETPELKSTVLSELKALLGVDGEPTFIHHRHWPKAIPQYKIGYGCLLEKMNQVERDFAGLKLAGNYRTGISLTSCIESALA